MVRVEFSFGWCPTQATGLKRSKLSDKRADLTPEVEWVEKSLVIRREVYYNARHEDRSFNDQARSRPGT